MLNLFQFLKIIPSRALRGTWFAVAIFVTSLGYGAPISDDFSQGFNTQLWSVVDPVGNSSVSVAGNALRIAVPAGSDHDYWTGALRSPRVMQPISDSDFEIEAKFQSSVTAPYQLQGLLVEQDANDSLRFDVYSDGAKVRVFAASFVSGTASVKASQIIASSSVYYLKVKRQGSNWIYSYSADGNNWTVAVTFSRSMSISQVGVFAGNAAGSSSPAFTAVVDFFFNTASPIVPEDASAGTGTVNATVVGNGAVSVNPSQATYEIGQSVQLTATPATGFIFAGWSGDLSGTANPAVLTVTGNHNVIATFNAAPPPPEPSAIISDDFSAGLDSSVWSIVDPVGDANVSVSANALRFVIPGGVDHDYWSGAFRSPRVLQTVSDTDFEVEAKFQSAFDRAYQIQGILVQQDAANSLRFDVYFNGSTVRLFAASFTSGSASTKLDLAIPAAQNYYLKIRRQGNLWTYFRSADGSNWSTVTSFTHPMTVTKVGVFAGNAAGSGSPAFTSVVDYFFNTASPILPEDGESQLGSVNVNVVGSGSVTKNPSQPTYEIGQVVQITAIPNAGHVFTGWTGDSTGTENPKSFIVTGNNNITANFAAQPSAAPLVSDDFSQGLNSSLWTVINPVGDASLNVSGNALHIHVPAGVDHDLWAGAMRAPKVMQNVSNSDFEMEAKFQSTVNKRHQFQGFYVEQDSQNGLRFDVYSDGSAVRLFAASFLGSSATVHANTVIPSAPAYFLRVKRQGSQWTFSYSLNGSNWTTGAVFARSITTSKIGLFAGNASGSSSPAFTAVVDYFFNTASPVIPEDGGQGTLAVKVEGQGSVEVSPSLPEYQFGDIVQLTATPASANWAFTGWTGDLSGSSNPGAITIDGDKSVKAVFTPTNPETLIQLWYGNHQQIGHSGIPQVWANVMGSISVPGQVASLSCRLNGSPYGNLSMGPSQSYRLAQPGDFNAEVAFEDLSPGLNQVTIVAQLQNGSVFQRHVTLDYSPGNFWPLPYSVDWNTVTSIHQVAQPVDGHWQLASGGVRSIAPGYDRLLAIGDIAWESYQVTVPITVHSVNPQGIFAPPLVGVLLRWDGHSSPNGEQPGVQWAPVGALGVFELNPSGHRLQIIENNFDSVTQLSRTMQFGIQYAFKMRVEKVTGTPYGKYSFKVWRSDLPEPAAWDLQRQATSGLSAGSLLLLAHHTDATFGNVTVEPIGQQPPVDTQAPSAPTIQSIDAVSPTSVALSWAPSNDNVGVTGYQIFRDSVLVGTAFSTSFTDNSAAPGANYSYVVRARDGAGNTSVPSVSQPISTFSAPAVWWQNEWPYRIPFLINPAGYARNGHVVDLRFDLSKYLTDSGLPPAVDVASLRIVEVDSSGVPINDTVPFQFDQDQFSDPGVACRGTLIVSLTGATQASSKRRFHLYFAPPGSSAVPLNTPQQILVTDNIADEGQLSYQIDTPQGSMFYHKAGAGFSSWVDSQGNDWINYHPTGGAHGNFRGIPNMVYPEGHFHPGSTTATSALRYAGPLKATIQSTTLDGKWECRWEIYPGFARMTMVRAAGPFWFLYEGTPGGVLDASDLVVRPGLATSASQSWLGDLPGDEWVYFVDVSLGRSLYAVSHQMDSAPDSYRPMDNAMTVFGFGRDLSVGKYLNGTPQSFTVGLANSTASTEMEAVINSASRPVIGHTASLETL
jgi:uncharacterized repeat protein (TIGR02543 family)